MQNNRSINKELIKQGFALQTDGNASTGDEESVLNFGDNGLELDVVFWSKRSLFIEIHRSDIRFEIDRKFREHTIEYPYPQMDIHHAPKEK